MASQTPTHGESEDATGGVRRPADAPLPPGPDGYPLLGNAVGFFRDPFAFYDTLADYGDVVRWRVPRFSFTTVLHPEHVERVLVEEHDRFERNVVGDFGFDFAPEGVFSVEGEQWRRQRRSLQPAFTIESIRSYADTMAACAERTAARWDDGQEVVLNETFSGLTLRTLTRTLFDVDVDPDEDDEVITRAARVVDERFDATDPTTFLPNWLPTPGNRTYRKALDAYRDRVRELIERRRRDGTDGDDLLSRLVDGSGPDEGGLSEEEVRDNLLTFMFAGHETTSLALTYAIMLVAQDDAAGRRLREECDAVLDGERPDFEDVRQLTYSEKVVKEALRLHPPAHLILRRATDDAVVGGYCVPEGTVVTLPLFEIQTDDRFYDDPDEFRPDRWTDEFENQLPEYAYFPFGGGPRHCIGMRFAMLELRIAVALLADRFEFELLSDPDPAIASGITHRPKDDVRVRVYRR